MGVDWDKIAKQQTGSKEVVEHEAGYVAPISDEDIDKKVSEAENSGVTKSLNCIVLGRDGSAKSGIVMAMASKYPKKTMFIDLDGGDKQLKDAYYPNEKKIIIVSPLVSRKEGNDIIIDYQATIATIKALVLKVIRELDDYDAIVIDGLSSLLKDSEYLMRMEKNMEVDGGVNQLYWKVRAKTFVDVLEIVKSIPKIDKFYIGHEDFAVGEEQKNNPKEKVAAPKLIVNRMVHQRILMKKIVVGEKVQFTAQIDKSKYNVAVEGKEYTFCEVDKGKLIYWKPEIVFEGLRG